MTYGVVRSLLVLAAAAGASASLALPAQAATKPQAQTRITEIIDESHRIALPGNVHPLAQARYDLGPAAASMPMGRMMLVLRRSAEQQQALEEFLAEAGNPASPSYRQWLTPAEFGAAFGPADGDLDAVRSWLESHGLKIEKIRQGRSAIEFSGCVDQVQSAFHTAIHSFDVDGERHWANVSDPEIPAALAPVVAGVWSLNDFRPSPQAERGGTARYDEATHTILPELTLFGPKDTPNLFVVPADAAAIYDTPNPVLNPGYRGKAYDGSGVKIGIAGDSNVTMQDIENYRIAFLGETAATANLPTVVVDGDDPGLNGDEAEALLDTEIAGGIAPQAGIYLYTSDRGPFSAVLRALDDNVVSILNISFAGCEVGLGDSGNAFMLAWAEQAAAQGISVTVAAGDHGSAGCDGGLSNAARSGLAVNGIGSTPWTIAVGGTDFDTLPGKFSTYVETSSTGSAPYYRTAKGYIPERPWNDSTSTDTSIAANVPYKDSNGHTDILAGGGGASSCATQGSSGNCLGGYDKPAFQTSLTPADQVRDLPDVSLLASNGFYQAVWAVCADNVANDDLNPYTDCQTRDGKLTSASTVSGYGGTSTSAPAFAGMLALVVQAQGGARLGQADAILYQLAKSKPGSVFHDITLGDNSVYCFTSTPDCGPNNFLTGYNAKEGYDQASGLGSVDAAELVNNWSSVRLASTSTTLTIDHSAAPVKATHGTALTFSVEVAPSSASGVVGILGTPSEPAGGPLLNGQFAIPLSKGAGSAAFNGLPGGSYPVSARYGGDAGHAASTSSPIDVTIEPENSTTTLEGVANLSPTLFLRLGSGQTFPYGTPISLSSQIAGTSADELKSGTEGVATGTVSYECGSTVVGTAPVGIGNQVNWPPVTKLALLPPGACNLTADYSGDASFKPSASPAIAITIAKGPTGTTPTVSSSSIPASGAATVTVQVVGLWGILPIEANLGAPITGSVTLTANGSTLATITSLTQIPSDTFVAVRGKATIQGSQLAYGTNTITAAYSGDDHYAPSSGTFAVTVSGVPADGVVLGNSGAIGIRPGKSTGTTTLSVTPTGGFTGKVKLGCSIITMPPNSSGLLVPVVCNVASEVTINSATAVTTPLTITAPANTTAGAYVVAISAANAATGKLIAIMPVDVTVGPAYGFVLNNSGNISIGAGDIITNYVQIAFTAFGGFTGNIDTTCAVAGGNATAPPTCTFPSPTYVGAEEIIVATLFANTTSSTTPGTYVFTVTGTDAANGAITASTSVKVTVTAYSASFTLSNSGNVTLGPGMTSASSTITVTPVGGYKGTVPLGSRGVDLNNGPADNAIDIFSYNDVTGVQVNTVVKVTSSTPDWTWSLPPSVTITGTSPVTATLTVTAVPPAALTGSAATVGATSP
jgi:hypothetical protein